MVYGFCNDRNFCWVRPSYVKNGTRVKNMGHHIEGTAFHNITVKALKFLDYSHVEPETYNVNTKKFLRLIKHATPSRLLRK
jgi:hypothetical protein